MLKMYYGLTVWDKIILIGVSNNLKNNVMVKKL